MSMMILMILAYFIINFINHIIITSSLLLSLKVSLFREFPHGWTILYYCERNESDWTAVVLKKSNFDNWVESAQLLTDEEILLCFSDDNNNFKWTIFN